MGLTSTCCKIKETTLTYQGSRRCLFYPVYIIYLDYRKAVDSVPHERLLEKLKALKINSSIIMWIRSFLTDR